MTSTNSEQKRLGYETLNERPYTVVIAEALRKTSGYRELVNQVNRILNKDLSLGQPFYIQGREQGEENVSPITARRSHYEKVRYIYGEPPERYSGTLYLEADFGYRKKSGSFDRIGTIPWMIVGDDGVVTHIGAPAEKGHRLVRHFTQHMFGWEQTESDKERLSLILKTLIKELRSPFHSNGCKKLLQQFLTKRDHNPDWEKKGNFAYFDPTKFDLWKFSRKHGFSSDEMYRAGLMDLSISKSGVVSYFPKLDKCVLIPFIKSFQPTGNKLLDFLNQYKKEFNSFRMRIIDGKLGAAKYRSFSLIRSLTKKPPIDDQLYNNHLLEDAEGKDIYLTEGEFKCHVATQKTGYITLGILGITMVSDEMLDRILTSKARSITIVLDADIGAKAIKRADGLTDSERAAYEIALRLKNRAKELGLSENEIPEIKIGKLKRKPDGDKQGLDDYIIPMSDLNSKIAMEKLRLEAKDLSDYAKSVGKESLGGLNEDLARVKLTRSEVKQAIFSLENIQRRSNLESDPNNIEGLLETLYEMEGVLDKAWRVGLWQLYGVTRLNLPHSTIKSLKASPVPNGHKKRIIGEGSSNNLIEDFAGDIACIEIYFSDMPFLERTPNIEAIELPYSMKEALQYFAGIRSSQLIFEDFIIGADLFGANDAEKTFLKLQTDKNFAEFTKYLLAGFAERQFKSDEYTFRKNTKLVQLKDRAVEQFGEIDLTIHSKTSKKAEAILFCPIWRVGRITEYQDEFLPGFYHKVKSLLHDEINDFMAWLPSNPARASIKTGIEIARARAFLRSPGFELQRAKFDRIVGILTSDEKGREAAQQLYRELPLPEGYIEGKGVVVLTPNDLERLISYFDKQGLLNQAVQAGFYNLLPDGGIVSAFSHSVEIIPTITRGVRSVRISPFSFDDHVTHYDSRPKIFYPVHGARSTAASMDPNNQVFLGENLANAKGKTVVIAQNERDAIILDAYLSKRKYVVIGLNSELTPRSSVISSIKRSGCLDVVYLGTRQTHGRYDHLTRDSQNPFLFDVFDLERRLATTRKGEEPKILRWAPLPRNITSWVMLNPRDRNPQEQIKKELEDFTGIDCQPLVNIHEKFLGVSRKEHKLLAALSRALEVYESYLEDPTNPSEEKFIEFEKCVTSLKYNKGRYADYIKKIYGEEVTDNLNEWLKERYLSSPDKFPESKVELSKFRMTHPHGIELRKKRKDLDYELDETYLEGFRNIIKERFILNGEAEKFKDYEPLATDQWREEVGRLGLEKAGAEAKRLHYMRRLEQIISIGIKRKMIVAPSEGRVFEIRHISTLRVNSEAGIAFSKRASNGTEMYVPSMAVAAVEFNFRGEEVRIIGHGANAETAKHMAAKNAFNYLKNKKVNSDNNNKITLGFLWRTKYQMKRSSSKID